MLYEKPEFSILELKQADVCTGSNCPADACNPVDQGDVDIFTTSAC